LAPAFEEDLEMFDKLIVSEPDQKAVKNRRGYFMVSSLVVGVLFITAVVVSIFAADLTLGTNDFELTEMLAPVELATAAAPEPVRQPRNEQNRPSSQIATRQVNMQAVSETPRVPDSISTTPNTVASRPTDSRFVISDRDTNPSNPAGSGRDPKPYDNGLSGISTIENKTEPADDTPPPARSDPPKRATVVSKGVINGIAQDLPKPVYSAAARAVRAQGKVDVQVTIDESGRVISARAASGHPLLREAAESAARRARFSPTKLSDVPVKVTGVIVYNFTS
jgi:TonB family protein